jgi:hypothetical protein
VAKTKRRPRLQPREDRNLWMPFRHQPAQIAKEEIQTSEDWFHDSNDGIVRRVAFASLAQTGAELVEGVKRDPEMSGVWDELAKATKDYADRLHTLAELMETASVRMILASAASRPGAP